MNTKVAKNFFYNVEVWALFKNNPPKFWHPVMPITDSASSFTIEM